MKLYIGNKNYSSWSMRAGVLLRQFDLPHEEVMVWLDDLAADGPFKQQLASVTPAGRVPVLVDGAHTVWDSLAIAETLAEQFPDRGLWPADPHQRAHARALCCEMHAGFGALRQACPMNIEAQMPELGQRLLAEQPQLRADLQRLVQMWTDALARSGGPLLFGRFSIADAFYAPVVARLRSFALPVPPVVQAWMDAVWASPGVSQWVAGALAERRYLALDEPYRTEAQARAAWAER